MIRQLGLLVQFCSAVGMLLLVGCATSGQPRLSTGEAKRDQAVRLQLFLDANRFGPGVIDGRDGEFTAKALARYNFAHGLPSDQRPDLEAIIPYRQYTVTAEDRAKLGTMAEKPEDLAKQKSLPYVGLAELLGERFHTTRGFLYQINPGLDIDTLPAGAAIRVPNVTRPFYLEKVPSMPKTPRDPALAGRTVLVDTPERMLEIRESGRLLAAFPITPGSEEHPAPAGNWKIAGIATFPWYRYDEGVLKRGERTKDYHLFPPGPNSPVGIVWMGLNRPGIGIHGTAFPETIGRSGSHGCIRLSNWDAAEVRKMVTVGTPVTIR